MEKVSRLPLQAGVLPVIAPGVAGIEVTVTGKVCAAELPQVLLAVTETVPLDPALAVMALMIEPPVVQPPGSDHV